MKKSKNENQNPLQELLVDQVKNQKEIDLLLAQILKPLLEIEKEGEIYLKERTRKLPIEKQILILICGQLARKRLGEADNEGLTQKEILQFFKTVPEGTVKAMLNSLRKKRLVFLKEKRNSASERRLEKIKDFLGVKADG